MENTQLVGRIIDNLEIYGELSDTEGKVIEADLMLSLEEFGLCGLTVVTKRRHENMILERHVSDMNQLDDGGILDQVPELETPQFVVNESGLTPELLEHKFLHHTVWPALADCLIPQQSYND